MKKNVRVATLITALAACLVMAVNLRLGAQNTNATQDESQNATAQEETLQTAPAEEDGGMPPTDDAMTGEDTEQAQQETETMDEQAAPAEEAEPGAADAPVADEEAAAPQEETQQPQAQTTTEGQQGRPVRVSELIGLTILNPEGEEVADVYDIVLDSQSGRVRHVVLQHGGLFGIGGEFIAVPWKAFSYLEGDDGEPYLVLDITEEEIDQIPEYPVYQDNGQAAQPQEPEDPAQPENGTQDESAQEDAGPMDPADEGEMQGEMPSAESGANQNTTDSPPESL